ncbi:hypothetical protein [Noviherbaspirillum pedocola]|uniref:Uncharacterized protein n=1 Tax=Noviherbaspirillum pedocola TaxID=2801341 RepID=A0A934SZS6_9BURK|nr:hypothetical protein [Noviherbaspirillum pedocola]MBK4738742.1 hypothetical protein [Noviherbaspirillum pedocola]
MNTQQASSVPMFYAPDLALQQLAAMEAEVQSDMSENQIAQRLQELSQQAFLMRSSGREILSGIVDDHTRAVAANAVLTHRLQCKLNAIKFYQRHPKAALPH